MRRPMTILWRVSRLQTGSERLPRVSVSSVEYSRSISIVVPKLVSAEVRDGTSCDKCWIGGASAKASNMPRHLQLLLSTRAGQFDMVVVLASW